MRFVKILRGVPGCGKSTYCKALNAAHFARDDGRSRAFEVFSADHFFLDVDQVYRFDPKRLGAAHSQCLKKFLAAIQATDFDDVDEILIVDNTNTTVREMSTYVDLCKAHKISFEIVTIDTPPEIAAHRNNHGVPVEKVYEMHRRLIAAQIPKDWPHIVVLGVF